MDADSKLGDLRQDFLDNSTQSLPIAGMIFWTVAAVASQVLVPVQLAYFVGFGSGMVFPLGVLIDRLRGRDMMKKSDNPVLSMFMRGIVMAVLLWPLVIIAGLGNPPIIVLGAAILMGIVWIPYGWAADDPVGLRHGLGRALLSYAAYLFVAEPWKTTAICLVVLISYTYSMLFMRRPARDAALAAAAAD